MKAKRTPYAAGPASNTNRAISGITVWKLNARHADHGHEQQGPAQVRGPPRVPETFAQLAGGPGDPAGPAELLGPHAVQGDDDGHVGKGVQEEAQRQADQGDQPPGQGRADDAAGVHHHAVQAHRVGQVLGRDHLGHEALSGGVVDQRDQAEQEGQDVDRPQRDEAGGGQDPQDQGQDPGRGLGEHGQAALVEPVGDHPAPRPGDQERHELEGDDRPEGHPAPGQPQDEPGLGHGLHPGSGDRDDLPGEVPAVVVVAQGVEGPSQPVASAVRCGPPSLGEPNAGQSDHPSSMRRSRRALARRSVARSSGARDRRRRAR